MKRLITSLATAFVTMGCVAQTDPVVMTIAGKPITLSEFEYSFNKNNSEGVIDRKGVEDYVPLFVNFKMKVAAAEEARYDTLTSIQKELRSYKEQMLLPTLSDEDFIEREARATYDNTAARFDGQDILIASHILVLMRQDATDAQQAAAKARIDSISQALQAGADFAELARKCSDDKGSAARGGSLGRFGKGMMIPDFENAAYALQPGQVSAPVKSTVGWHIIKLEDRHPFEPYEHHRDDIIRFLEQRGIREAAANHLVDSLARRQGISRDEMVAQMFDQMISHDSEAKFLAQEYYDGTLMYEISKKQIWDPAAADIDGQTRYFAQHKKQYSWDSPRFKGAVIYAKDKATAEAAKKILKKEKDSTKWAKALSVLNTDTVNVRISNGVYKQGDDKNIDLLVFGVKPTTGGSSTTAVKGLPVVDSFGKIVKKPETMDDVKGQIMADYQAQKEQEWVEELRKKYAFTVNEDVLKQVNK